MYMTGGSVEKILGKFENYENIHNNLIKHMIIMQYKMEVVLIIMNQS